MTFLPLTADFRQSSVSASWIHKKIRDNEDLGTVIAACRQNPDLIWECNSRRWTAMHVAASSHNVSQWKGLLQEAAGKTTGNKICCMKTDMGYTCLDLFFRRALFPLPWQRRRQEVQRRADILRESIELMCSDRKELARLEAMLGVTSKDSDIDFQQHTDVPEDVVETEIETDAETKVDPIQIVAQFWKDLEVLLCVICFDSVECKDRTSIPVLQTLSSLEWCPYLVSNLAIRLFPKQLESKISPLHIWAGTKTTIRLYDHGMLKSLCQADPDAASICHPSTQRLPLQTALALGKSWLEIQPLFDAYPNAVCHLDDTCTRLPTFCLPATIPPPSKGQIESIAKRCDPQRLSVWCYISNQEKQRALQQAEEYLECQRLTTIYELLCRNPSAIRGEKS